MPPRSRQRNTAQETPPAPEDPVRGARTRAAGCNARAATSDMPLPPTTARTSSLGDQACGFAGLSGTIFHSWFLSFAHVKKGNLGDRQGISKGVPDPTVVNPAQVPAARARSIPQPIFPQIPARRAVNGLVNQLTQQAAMASPGPCLRDLIHGNSDVEDLDSEDFPIVQHQQPLLAPALSSAANSDDENPPPRRAAAQKKVPGRRRGCGGTAAPTPAETTDDIEAGSAYVFTNPKALARIFNGFKSFHSPPSFSEY
ncbi:hypothetical protein DFH08DRAFT_828285 [Mycena albidolilacea]|uniref:Uncharacterized protein n=1 Tax=Mycena albidolilacea TaxID=1033008 RepID=A0AAD7E6F1_9AGAR|nr:hypothetical protein DFH08DRAFT_828285 [Mycena albidolilacea]